MHTPVSGVVMVPRIKRLSLAGILWHIRLARSAHPFQRQQPSPSAVIANVLVQQISDWQSGPSNYVSEVLDAVSC